MPLRRGRLGRVEWLLEGERDWGAEQLEGSGLDGGGGGEPVDALSGEDDDLAGEGGQVGEQVLIAGDGQAAGGVPRGVGLGASLAWAGSGRRAGVPGSAGAGTCWSVKVSSARAARRCQVR